MSERVYDPVTIARQFQYVRELPDNRGLRVNAIQKWAGGESGQSWCAYFAWMVLDICYQGACPIPRTGSCDVMLTVADSAGWEVREPQPGDLFFRVRAEQDAHHVGFVCDPITPTHIGQISGNTSHSGTSSNGDGVYERTIPRTPDLVFVRIP